MHLIKKQEISINKLVKILQQPRCWAFKTNTRACKTWLNMYKVFLPVVETATLVVEIGGGGGVYGVDDVGI